MFLYIILITEHLEIAFLIPGNLHSVRDFILKHRCIQTFIIPMLSIVNDVKSKFVPISGWPTYHCCDWSIQSLWHGTTFCDKYRDLEKVHISLC